MLEKFDLLIEITLNICAQIVKKNVKGVEEITLILSDLGIVDKVTTGKVIEVF